MPEDSGCPRPCRTYGHIVALAGPMPEAITMVQPPTEIADRETILMPSKHGHKNLA